MTPILIVTLLAAATAVAGDAVKEIRPLIDFEDPDARAWTVVNDGVMGGMSRSSIRVTPDRTGLFSGTLSLENSGGFASVRTGLPRRDLSAREGLEVRVRGDGRAYQLRLRMDDRFDGIAYRAGFETRAGVWTTIRMPFAAFEPVFRGRIVRDAAPLDPGRLRSLGFLLADKTAGDFRLEIGEVRPYGEVPGSAGGAGDVDRQ